MRVAMVTQSYPPVIGGVQRLVQRVAPLLERRGCEVFVVTRRWPGTGTPPLAREPGLEVRRVWVPRSKLGASVAYSAGGAAAVVRWRPDVIHVHDLLSSALVGALARGPARAPVVATVHSAGAGGDVDRMLGRPLGPRRVALLSRTFAAITCQTEASRAEIVAAGFPAERIHLVPYSVDATVFRPPSTEERAAARAALGLPLDEQVALYAGRFADVKRLDVLIAAFRAAPGHLVLVGDGTEAARLRELAADRALGGRVTVREPVEDPRPLYHAADLYVSASRTEGMSVSVMEAMASGLAVVAVPAAGMPDLLSDGAGVVVDGDSRDAIAAAVTALAADEERRAALGAAARARTIERFGRERMADRWLEIYREAAGR